LIVLGLAALGIYVMPSVWHGQMARRRVRASSIRDKLAVPRPRRG